MNMSAWSDWLALAGVIAAVATFILGVIAAFVAAVFTKRTFLTASNHEVAKLREGWKERLRWNLADLIQLVEAYESASDEDKRQKLRIKILRRAVRTKLMLTPEKHQAIESEIDALLASAKLNRGSALIDAARPILKETWEQIEDQFLNRKNRRDN